MQEVGPRRVGVLSLTPHNHLTVSNTQTGHGEGTNQAVRSATSTETRQSSPGVRERTSHVNDGTQAAISPGLFCESQSDIHHVNDAALVLCQIPLLAEVPVGDCTQDWPPKLVAPIKHEGLLLVQLLLDLML